MSITHQVNGRAFTVEVYWLRDPQEFTPGPQAFRLIYSVDGVKVTKEQFVDELCDNVAAEKLNGTQSNAAPAPHHPDLRPDVGGTEGD